MSEISKQCRVFSQGVDLDFLIGVIPDLIRDLVSFKKIPDQVRDDTFAYHGDVVTDFQGA